MQDSKEGARLKFEIMAEIPQADLFHRDHPADLEGSAAVWEVARAVADFGCALLQAQHELRPDHLVKDVVLTGLMRRSLVTCEGGIELLRRGLFESAIAQLRTLLDIELALRLVAEDESGAMAKRLAGWHYLSYQRHGEQMLSHRPTREGSLGKSARIGEVIEAASAYARFVEDAMFDNVREQLRSSRYWHGFDRPQDAFEKVGASSDYLMTYGSATWFVHASNIDHDFGSHNGGVLAMKPLVERNPTVIQPLLGLYLMKLLSILERYIEVRGYPDTESFKVLSKVRLDDGSIEEVDAFHALQGLVVSTFPSNTGLEE